jgi:hypothetical protein
MRETYSQFDLSAGKEKTALVVTQIISSAHAKRET